MRIALVAKAGVGKTTVANYLVEKHGFVKISLADKLKEICKDLWPEQFENDNKPRELLQRFGTDMCRQIDEATWVNYVIRQINLNPDKNYVIDDCRFINEANILDANNFAIIKLQGKSRGDNITKGQTKKHRSETEMDKIDRKIIFNVIINDGNLDDLYHEIDILLWMIRGDSWDEFPLHKKDLELKA